jgi:uncharacterized protein YuzE
MRFSHDPESGALYLRLRDGEIAETVELRSPGALADVDDRGNVLGLEFLSLEEFVYFMDSAEGEASVADRIDPQAFLPLSEEAAERVREDFTVWLETYRRWQFDRAEGTHGWP